jgi:hypothetical protein
MDNDNNLYGTWKSWTDDLDTDFFAKDFVCNGIEYINRFLIKKNTIPNASAVIFKKEIFDSTGGADETIKYCSDWLLWMKILSRSDIAFISECLNHFRFHTESVIAVVREPHGKYNVSMRKKWKSFLEKEKIKILMNSANENLSSEYFKWGEEHFNAGNKWRGCRYVICSALYPSVDPVKLLQKMKYVVYRLLSL